VVLQDALLSYRAVLDHPIHRDLPQALVPGALTAYDLPDLIVALAPREVVLVNPLDPVGQPLRSAERERTLLAVRETDRRLGHPDRVAVARRGRGGPPDWR
jgi:hypothetical protein